MKQEEADRICGTSNLWHKFVMYLARNRFPSVPVDKRIRMAFAETLRDAEPKYYDWPVPKNFQNPMGEKKKEK